MLAFTVDDFHEVERRSTYSPANFVSVAPELEHPGPRTVRLDAEHEALQGGIVEEVRFSTPFGV